MDSISDVSAFLDQSTARGVPMIEIALRWNPATGELQVAAPGVPAAVLHLMLDVATTHARQNAMRELREAAAPTIAVPPPGLIRKLGG